MYEIQTLEGTETETMVEVMLATTELQIIVAVTTATTTFVFLLIVAIIAEVTYLKYTT